MPRPRGPSRDLVALEIDAGDTIRVRRDLTVRDADRIQQFARRAEQIVAMAACLIVEWSLCDADGRPIPWPAQESLEARMDVLYGLDVPTYEAIVSALDRHLSSDPKATPDASGPTSPSAG